MTGADAAHHAQRHTLAAALLAEPLGLLDLLALRSDVLHEIHLEQLIRPAIPARH